MIILPSLPLNVNYIVFHIYTPNSKLYFVISKTNKTLRMKVPSKKRKRKKKCDY